MCGHTHPRQKDGRGTSLRTPSFGMLQKKVTSFRASSWPAFTSQLSLPSVMLGSVWREFLAVILDDLRLTCLRVLASNPVVGLQGELASDRPTTEWGGMRHYIDFLQGGKGCTSLYDEFRR